MSGINTIRSVTDSPPDIPETSVRHMLFYTLYNFILILAILLLSPLWLLWMVFVPKIRVGFGEKLGLLSSPFQEQLKQTPQQNRIWIHTVSVGELNAAKPLIQALLHKHYPVMLSTTTATGNELAHKTFPDLPILFFPFDLPWIIAKILKALQPSVIVILETEIWPNLLFQATQQKTPVLLFNGRLSKGSFAGYSRFKPFFKWVLNHFTKLMMQSHLDAKRMIELGVNESKVAVGGNLKFDLASPEETPLLAELKQLFQFPKNAPVIAFASTHKGEEELFIELFQALRLDFPDLKAILAPRHPERNKGVSAMLTGQGLHFLPRSQITQDFPCPKEANIILLDTIGELNTIFSLSTLACMGGTFVDWGGHNPLEPINASIPVVFGPSMENFKEITERVLEAHAGFQVQTLAEAEQVIRELLTRPEDYDHIVRNGQKLMTENRGVTETVVSCIQEVLRENPLAGVSHG